MKKQNSLIYLLLIICSFSSLRMNGQASETKIEQDPLIQELLVLKSKMTESNELGERYKIQLYYGELNGANKVKEEFEKKYNSWPSSLEYETPNYKVWIGDFRNRLEAERAFIELKKDFKSAFIFRP